MPNWCSNILTISGSTAEVKPFIDSLKNLNPEREVSRLPLVLDFRVHAPLPEDSNIDVATRLWGTKWLIDSDDAGDWDILDDGQTCSASLFFMSAWSPPLEWLKTVGELYPSIDFLISYEEPANRFQGSMIISQGEVTLDETDEFAWEDEFDEDEEDLD